MKNILESFAIFLVSVLSLVVIFLIVQYNMIEEDTIEDVSSIISQKKVPTKTNTTAYLNSLEGYGDDVDVKVDAKKEDHSNEVVVKSELNKDDLGAVVEDKSKSSYTENLEKYAEDAKKIVATQPKIEIKKKDILNPGEPEKLPQDEIVDEIGMAIDAALDDL